MAREDYEIESTHNIAGMGFIIKGSADNKDYIYSVDVIIHEKTRYEVHIWVGSCESGQPFEADATFEYRATITESDLKDPPEYNLETIEGRRVLALDAIDAYKTQNPLEDVNPSRIVQE